MLGSKNDFFYLPYSKLEVLKLDMLEALRLVDRSKEDIQEYLDAYNYFICNPSQFDGTTVMRDLFTIKGEGYKLSVDSLLHDYESVTGANKSFVKWYYSAIKYYNNLLKNGKEAHVTRLVLLLMVGVFFVPYNKFFK